MRNTGYVLLLIFLFPLSAIHAQQTALSDAVREFNDEAHRIKVWNNTNNNEIQAARQPLQTGVKQYLEKFRNTAVLNEFNNRAFNSDSILIIGAVAGDSLIITGDWLCKVDILVFGDGILRFENANATLLGNLYVWGDQAEITADSSTLYIPQLYFYQRTILAAGAGRVRFNQVTLDFSGLSHNIVATDSSSIEFNNVKKVGFSTNGVYGKAKYFIDGTNLAGEFVIGDQCQLEFHNANTVLLWHEVPNEGLFHFKFPPADTVSSYNFNPHLPGIGNIDYQISLTNCTDVMWAIMPADGSDVDITDSEIRAIGLWFLAPDSVNVNGLVNNSDYTDYTAALSDRNLRLRNSSVQTWSLYPMKQSEISVSGCIVGEIGSMGTSQVLTSSVFVDGSGGYMWANDTSFLMSFATPLNTHVRSEKNGILIYSYSPLNLGTATALGNSILLVVQSSLPEEPVAYDNACIWHVNMVQPSSGNSNSFIPITGYALIDRTPTCIYPDMAWYQMFYSSPENDSLIAITPKITNEKRNDTLALWNTAGLKPGQYLLHIFVSDASANPITVEAVRSFSINPGVFGVNVQSMAEIKIYPNPVSETFHIETPWADPEAIIFNSLGDVVWQGRLSKNNSDIDMAAFPAGFYIIKIYNNDEIIVRKLIRK